MLNKYLTEPLFCDDAKSFQCIYTSFLDITFRYLFMLNIYFFKKHKNSILHLFKDFVFNLFIQKIICGLYKNLDILVEIANSGVL